MFNLNLKKIFIFIIILTPISLIIPACSSDGDLCLFGSSRYTYTDYNHPSWKSKDKKKTQYRIHFIEQCEQESNVKKNILFKIFHQLCYDGHISDEYLPDAIAIQNSFIKDLGGLTGTTDEIFKKLLNPSITNKLNIETFNKVCAYSIPKNGDIDDFKIEVSYFEPFYFELCMSNFGFERTFPEKSERRCKGVMW